MIEQLQSETGMREAFRDQARTIVDNPGRFSKAPGIVRVGLEMEAGIIGEGGRPAAEAERDAVIGGIPFADVELGAAQLEWRTDPVIINRDGGVEDLAAQAVLRDRAMAASAQGHGLHILRRGTNPFIPIREIERTHIRKYQAVPDFHNGHRRRTDTVIGDREPVDVGDAAVVSLLNSLQCNLEASGLEDAVDLLNRSLMIGPQVVALSGNARFLDGRDTGLADVRMAAWEISHDTRNREERQAGKSLRVGLPSRYFTDVNDYLEQVATHPFILDDPGHALQIGIGLFWNDARIKFIGDSAVVEFRPVSIQPTVEEDLAVMLFYLGRLAWSRQSGEPLQGMGTVREQRALAMERGILPFAPVLPGELVRAREGLGRSGIASGITDGLFALLEERVRTGQTPADRSAAIFARRLEYSGDRSDALGHTFNNLV